MVRRSPRCVGFHCLTYARRQITHPQTVSLNQLVVNIEALIRGVIGEQIEVVTILSPVLAPCRSIQRDSKTATLNLVTGWYDGWWTDHDRDPERDCRPTVRGQQP